MKVIIVLAALVAIAMSAPADDSIVKYEYENQGENQYSFDVETSGGNKHSESGSVHPAGGEADSIAVKGSYSFVGDDGQTYTVEYTADENGFLPSGAHLPQTPSSKYFK